MIRRTLVCATAAILGSLSAVLPAAPLRDTSSAAVRPLAARRLPAAWPLEDGPAVERNLARGDDHRYQLTLRAGEFVRVAVAQRGVDLLASTRDEAGHPIADFDEEVGLAGEETVELVADASGVYTVAIAASPVAVLPGAYSIRIVSRRAATSFDRTTQEVRRLRTAAARLDEAGRFDEARRLLERALSLSEPARAPQDPELAMLLLQLAETALGTRDDARARSLDERALGIFERAWGADHPYAAKARSVSAILYEHAGQGGKAETLIRRALEAIEKSLGTDHRWYVQALITQANVRFDGGDFDAAEKIDEQAMAILERIDDAAGIPYAALLNNLGEIYRQKGDAARARTFFEASLAEAERLEGAESYRVSTTLQNLGIIAREQGDYGKALEYDTRALAMRERILGADHADIAPLLNNLAVLYHTIGDDDRALPVHFRALEIRERTVGPYHRGTLNSVGNLARIYASIGETAKALAFERRADAIVEQQLALNLAVGSERQKLAFVRSVSERTDRTISLHLQQAPGSGDAGSLAALVLLQRKGRVQDAMADVFAAVRHRIADPQDRDLMDRLNETKRELAQLALSAPERLPIEARSRSLAELEARREQLEATLSEHSAEFRAETQPVTVEALQATLPADAALLEFAVFRPFHPAAARKADEYGPPRYAAYVIRRHAAPAGVDLGDAAAIDQAIDALREALRDPGSSAVKARARDVYARVVQPLVRSLSGATRLVVSPDGHLNLVPFEALVGGDDRYLIERYAVTYVTSGRDLLRMQVPRAAARSALIIADPLFGEPRPRDAAPPSDRAPSTRYSITNGTELAGVYFAPLAATGAEAEAIKALFPDATLLTGSRATKAMLQQVKAPGILHIASHGFFLNDGTGGDGGAEANPLLRSGLALAEANLTRDGHRAGILTALEASGLDLWGTRLVTLSACDTGIGEIRNGEGVYGLRRAFVLAGAETLVMSLWPVSDNVARETMVAYYTGLRSGLGRGDALRHAKLALLQRPTRQHPYFWAGFIQSGDWTPLAGER